jgi:ABC-type branched-subunit amino acid transport system substrate-binding protein
VAVTKVRTALERDRCDFIVGVVFSNILQAIIRPVTEANTFLISTNAGPSTFAGRGCNPFFFTTSYNNDQVHSVIGQVCEDQGYKRVFVMVPNYQAGRDAVAGFIRKRALEDGQNYILLGDMNVVSPDDATMKALRKHKFVLPADLTQDNNALRWASNMGGDKHYDQIAFLPRKDELQLGASENNAGVLNVYKAVFTDSEAETYHPLGQANGQWPATPAQRKALVDMVVKATKSKSWTEAMEKNQWTSALLTGKEFEDFVEREFASLRVTMVKAGMI